MQSGCFPFFLACGDSGYSQHRFSQRKSAAVSGSFLLNVFILFSFPSLSRSHYLFLPVSSVICSKHPPPSFFSLSAVFVFPHLLPSIPFFLSTHFHSVDVPLSHSTLSCLSYFCPLQSAPLDKQDSKFALQHRARHQHSVLDTSATTASSSLLPSPLHLNDCRWQPAVR